MNAPNEPTRPTPQPSRPATDPMQAEGVRTTPMRRPAQSDGMGAILAVVAVATLIVVGLLYIMQPPADPPASVTSEAPATSPAPATPPAPSK